MYTLNVLHIHLYFLFTNGQVLKVKLIETVVIYFVVDGDLFYHGTVSNCVFIIYSHVIRNCVNDAAVICTNESYFK